MSDYPEEHVVPATPLTAAEVARLCLGRFRLGTWIIMGVVIAHGLVYQWCSSRFWHSFAEGRKLWVPFYKWSVLELSPMLLAVTSALLYRSQVQKNELVSEHCSVIPNGLGEVGLLATRRLIWMTIAVAVAFGLAPFIIMLGSSIHNAELVTIAIHSIGPILRHGIVFLSYLLLALVIVRNWNPGAVIMGVLLLHLAIAFPKGAFRSEGVHAFDIKDPGLLPALLHLPVAAICLYGLRTDHRRARPLPEAGGGDDSPKGTLGNRDARRALILAFSGVGLFILQYLTLGFMTGGRRQWTTFVWVLFGLMGASVVTALIALWFAGRSLYDPKSNRWKVGCAVLLAVLAILGTLAMLALFYLVGFGIAMGGAG